MDIDSFDLDDLHNIVEGMYCFAVTTEKSLAEMQKLTLDLIEYHESTDLEVLDGLNYYKCQIGMRPDPQYDWQNRQYYFENVLGHS